MGDVGDLCGAAFMSAMDMFQRGYHEEVVRVPRLVSRRVRALGLVSDVGMGMLAYSDTAFAQLTGSELVMVRDRGMSLSIHDHRQLQQRQCKEGSSGNSCCEQVPYLW